MSYNPKPTRVWSRVQNPCTYTDSSNNAVYQNVYVPLTGKIVPLAQAIYQDKLISKGNILQYKKNSSNLTKKQKYTQICKGMWTNRTKSYATQTQTYTNPNTSNLLRVNYTNITSPGTRYIPGPYNYNIPYPNGCISDTIKDGGSLLCNTVANPCSDEIIETSTVLKCYPTTCSDVPGPIQDLCWDSKLDTWYPRQRYIMPTSGTGWPEGYKGFVSALKPPTPVLTLDSSIACSLTLSWTFTNNDCIPISSYNIYINGQLYINVPYTTTIITINDLPNGNYSFYVTSLSNTIESDNSNTITINISQDWSALGSGLNNNICYTIAIGPNNSLYAGGSFTSASGVANTNYIAKWDITTNTWSALGTGLNDLCFTTAIGPNNSLYAGGLFTSASSVANTNYIAKWDINTNTWSALGTGLNDFCLSITIDSNSLYAGGGFTSASGVANTNYIAKWDINTNTWSALGTGLNDLCYTTAIGPNNSLYAGGNFTTAGGISANRIAKWDINTNTWSPLSSGLDNGICYTIAIGPDGSVYAGGSFTSASGVANTNYIAKWNGTTWSALGTGLNNICYALAIGSDGILYAGGNFTTAGGISANYIAKWNGTTWYALGTGLNNFCRTIAFKTIDCNLYIGGDFTTAGGVSANRIVNYKTIYT
jgi:hypothetical protein